MSIKNRISAGFTSTILILATVSILTFYKTQDIARSNQSIPRTHKTIVIIQTLLHHIYQIDSTRQTYLATKNKNDLLAFQTAKKMFNQVLPDLKADLNQRDIGVSADLREDELGLTVSAKYFLMNLMKEHEQILAAKITSAKKTLNELVLWTFLSFGIAVAIAIGATYRILASITNPLAQLTELVEHMQVGELDFRILMPREDEIGRLANAFNKMAETIAQKIKKETALANYLQKMSQLSISMGTSAITNHTSFQDVLQTIADQARELTHADYGALGITREGSTTFSPWVYSGISDEVATRIGRTPSPVGILGWIAHKKSSVRMESLKGHPASIGLPEHHPPMGALLSAQLKFNHSSIGTLYLARKPGREAFSEMEQMALELLAAQAGIALENIRLREELRKSLAAREEILAIVSHDLKNPLGYVRMASHMLLRPTFIEPTEKDKQALLQGIVRTSNHMNSLINDLLDVASYDAGKIAICAKVQDISPKLAELSEEFKVLADEKGITFKFENRTRNILLNCDSKRLHQVMYNLVGNAIKFTPRGGEVSVTVRDDANRVYVDVRDTGVGIDDCEVKNLFNRFCRPEKSRELGHGLGLYITKGIIEAHKGVMHVKSKVGEGSTFSFDLPLVAS